MSQLGVCIFGAHVLALVTSKDFLFFKIVTWQYLNILNGAGYRQRWQLSAWWSVYLCILFIHVTLAINKTFVFHPVGVFSFFVRMVSNLFSCLSVPSSPTHPYPYLF